MQNGVLIIKRMYPYTKLLPEQTELVLESIMGHFDHHIPSRVLNFKSSLAHLPCGSSGIQRGTSVSYTNFVADALISAMLAETEGSLKFLASFCERNLPEVWGKATFMAACEGPPVIFRQTKSPFPTTLSTGKTVAFIEWLLLQVAFTSLDDFERGKLTNAISMLSAFVGAEFTAFLIRLKPNLRSFESSGQRCLAEMLFDRYYHDLPLFLKAALLCAKQEEQK